MLIACNLPTFLWEQAVAYAAYLQNRAFTRVLKGETPAQAWDKSKSKADVSHL